MVKLNRIYTRTGDDGTTGLVDGSRVAKADRADGGDRRCRRGEQRDRRGDRALATGALAEPLTRIQNDLFDLGADLATPARISRRRDGAAHRRRRRSSGWSGDRRDERRPRAADQLHPARRQRRRRGAASGARDRRGAPSVGGRGRATPAQPAALAYLNRLSDYLFVAARSVNHDGGGDVLWGPGATR